MSDGGLHWKQVAVLVLVGSAAAGGGWFLDTSVSDRIENAEPVDATVVSSGLDERESRYGDDVVVQVTYEYRYDGREYRSENVVGGAPDTMSVESGARAVIAEYDAGETVTAWVSPGVPNRAFLEPAANPRSKIGRAGILVGVALLGAGLLRGLFDGNGPTAGKA
jgi:hypothetical protein